MKRWLYIGAVFLVLIVVGLYFLFSSLNSIVKAAVEKIGSEVTQAQVKLSKVEIELSSGKGAMRGLTVGNPSGFKSERALRLGEISLQLDIGSVTKDTVLIKEIAITAPEITYELGSQGSNLDALKRNIDAYSGKGKGEKTPAESKESGKKLVVERLSIRDGKVHVTAAALQGKSLTTALPDIHLTNVGKQKGGATGAELARQVLTAIAQGAAKAAASTEINKLLGAAKVGAPDVSGALGESAKKLFGR